MLPFPFWGFRYSWTFYSFVLFFFFSSFFSSSSFLCFLCFVFVFVLFQFFFTGTAQWLQTVGWSPLLLPPSHGLHDLLVGPQGNGLQWKCRIRSEEMKMSCTNHSQLPYTRMQVGLIHTTSTLPLWNKNKNGTRKCTWAIGVHFIVHLSTLCIQLGGWPKPFTQAKNAQLNLVWIYRSMCL